MNITSSGRIATLLIVLMLTACSGGSSSTAAVNPVSAASWDPADPLTLDERGSTRTGQNLSMN
jgi:ABC-type glycerol-3-phosphate transport system substrate-binding protein